MSVLKRWFLIIILTALLAAGWSGAALCRATTDDLTFAASPDGRWMAVLNPAEGSLNLQQPDGQPVTVFPPGSTISAIAWSPDSHTLLAVRSNWQLNQPEGSGVSSREPIDIWRVQFEADQPQPAQKLFESPTPAGPDVAEQIQLGQWSPNSRYILFWLGPLGASILADGLPLAVLDVTTGDTWPMAEAALLNPGYQSWASDSTAVAVTAGPGREAQTDKWLTLWLVAGGQATTVISQTEQIPGLVSWSPQGGVIAYAAIPANLPADESAHVAGLDNPRIAGRRIYLLDPATGQSHRLNQTEAFQDAPRWSADGATLYYVEQQGDTLQLMAANPATGLAQAVAEARQLAPEYVGYYGQSDFETLLAQQPGGETDSLPTPDGRWIARVNRQSGSLELQSPEGQRTPVFPTGSRIQGLTWSPDSRTLLAVRPDIAGGPIAIWQIQVDGGQVAVPTRLYQARVAQANSAQQIVFGHWSPNSRYILFWEGILSASILADGLPVSVLDVTTGQAAPVAEAALPNPRYQSWAADSSALALTAGGYRSAQVGKWLNIWHAAGGPSTTVISQTEQVPGIVAWSPQGQAIAYAAVLARLTGPEWADASTFDNPAIAGRRIYLLDPATGQSHRLNQTEAFQDAPRWSADGATLYYVERQGDTLQTMAANPTTGQAEVIPEQSWPLDSVEDYYGQFEWDIY